ALLRPPPPRPAPWRCGTAHPESRTGDPRAGDARHELPGHRAGLPALAAGPRAPAARRRHRHLPDPGDSLRELHPPPDHPLGAAVRGRGRAPDPPDLPPGAEPLRLRSEEHT